MGITVQDYLRLKDSTDLDNLVELVLKRNHDTVSLPIDVEYIAETYASVERRTWELQVDALSTKLLDPKPHIYLREVPLSLARRQRFTLAHELGHVLIPWHTSQIVCSLGEEDVEGLPDYEPEANYFASHLLMPTVQVRKIAEGSPSLAAFFEAVDAFELSPVATAIALTKCLVPGFIFRLWSWGKVREFSSDSNLPLPQQLLDRENQLRTFALDSGEFSVDGRQIEWYFLGDSRFEWTPVGEETRRSAEILRTVLSGYDLVAKFPSINGVISGLLSDLRTHNQPLLYNHINLRLRFHDSVSADLQRNENFQLYLRKMIDERVQKALT